MKHSTFFILCGALALGSLAFGITVAIHEKRKENKHMPAATLRELYEDNAASEPSMFDISPESCYDTTSYDLFDCCDLWDTLYASERGYLDV